MPLNPLHVELKRGEEIHRIGVIIGVKRPGNFEPNLCVFLAEADTLFLEERYQFFVPLLLDEVFRFKIHCSSYINRSNFE